MGVFALLHPGGDSPDRRRIWPFLYIAFCDGSDPWSYFWQRCLHSFHSVLSRSTVCVCVCVCALAHSRIIVCMCVWYLLSPHQHLHPSQWHAAPILESRDTVQPRHHLHPTGVPGQLRGQILSWTVVLAFPQMGSSLRMGQYVLSTPKLTDDQMTDSKQHTLLVGWWLVDSLLVGCYWLGEWLLITG